MERDSWLQFFQTFKGVFDKQPYDAIVRFAILKSHLIGPVEDCIRGFLLTENFYPFALRPLQDRFGNKEDQAGFYLGAVENLLKIKASDVPGLQKFYDEWNIKVQVIENMRPDVAEHLNDPRRMKLLVNKLPSNLVVGWATYQEDKGIGSDMRAFVEWLRKKVQILERVKVPPHPESGDKQIAKKQSFTPYVHVTMCHEVTQTERIGAKLQMEREKC